MLLAILLNPNTPLVIWQKIAYRTWFDSSQQVTSFTYSALRSLASAPPTASVPWNNDMCVHFPHHKAFSFFVEKWKDLFCCSFRLVKARLVVDLAKPWPSGSPWSSSQTYFSSTEPSSMNILTSNPTWRVSDEHYPVLFSHKSMFNFGPLFFQPLQVFFLIWILYIT